MPRFFSLSLQDSISALAHDLNYPALRKNKNIDAFLNRCKSPTPALSAHVAFKYDRQRPDCCGYVVPVSPLTLSAAVRPAGVTKRDFPANEKAIFHRNSLCTRRRLAANVTKDKTPNAFFNSYCRRLLWYSNHFLFGPDGFGSQIVGGS